MWGVAGVGAAPQPGDGAVVAASPAKLQWDAVAGAVSYEAYFGTDREAVGKANKASVGAASAYLGSSSAAECPVPSVYTPGGVWYWRVDVVTAATTVKGAVWYFTGQLALAGHLAGPDSYYVLADQQPALDGESGMVGYPEWVNSSTDNRPGRVVALRRVAGRPDWEVAQTLNKPTGTVANARFGGAVALRGGTAWIAAPGDGSVFKYVRGATGQWTYSGLRLRPPTALGGTLFGTSLALGEGWVAVGIPAANSPRTDGVAGNSDVQKGAVDIFDTATGLWVVRLYASASASRVSRTLGVRMTGEGATLAVINHCLETPLTRVEIFRRGADGGWGPAVALAPPDLSPWLYFGNTMALSGGVLLVGCPTQRDTVPGRIYAFERGADLVWRQTWRFNPSSPTDDFLIRNVAIQGNRAAFYFYRSGSLSAAVGLWQREADASWTRLGTTVQTAPGDAATGNVSALAMSEGYLLQCGELNFAARIRFYIHRAEANEAPVFTSQAQLYGEEGRAYRYEAVVLDKDPGDSVTLSASGLPPWLALQGGTAGRGLLVGTPPLGTTGEFPLLLTATDSRGAANVQAFTLRILPQGGLPVIRSLSPDQEVNDHERLVLEVALEGAGAATYQWLVNGILLDGQTSARFELAAVQASDAGVYTVRVTRAPAVVESGGVKVVVRQQPDRFGGDWVTLGGSSAHRGRYPATLGKHRLVPAWTSLVAADGSAVNQVATGGGLALVSYSNAGRSAPRLRALDLTSGVLRWERTVPLSNGFSPPTYHRGVVYAQRARAGTDSPDVRAWDAATGVPRWTTNYDDQYAVPYAPVVSDAGVFTMGGVHGGLYRHSLAGARQWFAEAPQRDEWTPLWHLDRLFLWTGGIFDEVSAADGVRLWTVNTPWSEWKAYAVQTVSAADGQFAAVLDAAALRLVDLAGRKLQWTQSGSFRGHPALADEVVYAISPGQVRCFRAADGIELAPYVTLGGDGLPRTGRHQPVVLDDCILISGETETWVFDRATRALLQRLPAGGALTYSDGILMAAGLDGVLRAFAVNQPVVLTPPVEPVVWTEDQAKAWTVGVKDPEGDALQVRVEGQPSWMVVSGVVDGAITLSGFPTLSSQAGDFTLRLRVDDGKFVEVVQELAFQVIAVNDAPTAHGPGELSVDEDGVVPGVNWRAFFDDEEDGSAGLLYAVEEPLGGGLASFAFDPATARLDLRLSPDFAGTVPLRGTARDSGGLEAAVSFALVVRPVPDAPRVAAVLPTPTVPEDGSAITVEAGAYFSDPDAGEVLRYEIVANDAPQLFSSASIGRENGRLELVWAPYMWGTARMTLRGTDSTGRLADTLLTVALAEPPPPLARLQGSARLNRQTGLVEQTVLIKNPGQRALGGFHLWVEAGPGAALYNGVAGASLAAQPAAPWAVPYQFPLAAGAEVAMVLEFYAPQRAALPGLAGAMPIMGSVPPIGGGDGGTAFAVKRVLPVPDGVLVEFSAEPGSPYRIEYSADGLDWKVCPLPLRAGGTAVQWIDRGPPYTRSRPEVGSSRFYRVRRG